MGELQRPRVLVVDDAASIRYLIRANLELAGFAVDEAGDGIDCLELLSNTVDLPVAVTVDVMMPRLDGVSTVAAIRTDPRLKDLVVVIVSTQGHPAAVQQGMSAGADAYVVKPFDPDDLVETVVGLVRDRRR